MVFVSEYLERVSHGFFCAYGLVALDDESSEIHREMDGNQEAVPSLYSSSPPKDLEFTTGVER